MNLKENLPEQVTIHYVDANKYKKSTTALYTKSGYTYVVDELLDESEVMLLGVWGIRRTGYKTRDVVGNSEYTRCGLCTTVTITQV